MQTMKDRIRARLTELGMSPREASLKARLSTHWLRDVLAGKAKSPKVENVKRLANVLNVTLEWLTGGSDDGGLVQQIPLFGLVGAGAEVMAFDESYALEYVDIPPGAAGIGGAARVQGDSQHPVYRNGDLIYWSEAVHDVESCLGKDCVVTLDDGRIFLKILERGSGAGLYTLTSHNAPPIRDVRVANICRVVWQFRS